MRRKWVWAVALTLGCAAAGAALSWSRLLEAVELVTYDLRVRHLSRPGKASPDVVLVAIDERSLEELKRNRVSWNWPRDLYAALVDFLRASGAKAVAFDMLFPEPDIDRLGSDGAENDAAFARAVKEAGNVIVGAQLTNRSFAASEAPSVPLPSAGGGAAESFRNALLPIEALQRSAFALGAVNFREDAEDGICRRATLRYGYRGSEIEHLALAAYRRAAGAGARAPGSIPVDRQGRFLIRWYGPGGPGGVFRYYSFVDLLGAAQDRAAGRPPRIPPAELQGKLVIVGATATGLFDYKATPWTKRGPYSGMEIHATVASNLLQGDFLTRAPRAVTRAGAALMAAAVCLVMLYAATLWSRVLVTGALAASWGLAAAWCFARWNLWVDVAAPEASLLLAFAVSALGSFMLEGRERLRLRSMFSRYVSPVVISEVLERRDEVDLGGAELTGTVLFSDIQDFTTVSESLKPKELVALLNGYFSATAGAILDHGGMIDKYIGDAIMAVFGAPIQTADHASRACAASLELQKRLRAASAKQVPLSLHTRIGLHTGPMIAGNIGTAQRMNYTVIGDTVNLASRLEGANKLFGTSILASGSTADAAKGDFVFRELDLLAVKGKTEAVPVYELLGPRGAVAPARLDQKGRFEEALRSYRAREFEAAAERMRSCLEKHPGDVAAQEYIRRCERLLEAPPPSDWDGVYHAKTK
ncbi:MAG: adenylate/guanylate cyclase domain-containing protein [Elusimicrobia bacterium]|nr:adenylate/guanylate cyclase domain-containing protein [Elusimicrobiota bacterium]